MDDLFLEGERRAALVRERRVGHGPSLVQVADEMVRGHEDLVEEDLVELRLARDLAQRADVDAVGLHVDHEVRDALVLRRVVEWRRPGKTDAPARVTCVRRPHLLAGEEPAAVDRRRACRQRREIAARAGFAEQLAPQLARVEDRSAASAPSARRCRERAASGRRG